MLVQLSHCLWANLTLAQYGSLLVPILPISQTSQKWIEKCKLERVIKFIQMLKHCRSPAELLSSDEPVSFTTVTLVGTNTVYI